LQSDLPATFSSEETHKASYSGTAELKLYTYQDSSVATSLLSMRKAKNGTHSKQQ